LSKYSSNFLLQAAFSLLDCKDSFPVSFLSRFSTIFLTTVKFFAACSALFRCSSSRKVTSCTQCNLFSIVSWRENPDRMFGLPAFNVIYDQTELLVWFVTVGSISTLIILFLQRLRHLLRVLPIQMHLSVFQWFLYRIH